ncbi:MAG: ATP-binding cassette domain-containing protein [Candidatus Bathyarchaeia archaeon]
MSGIAIEAHEITRVFKRVKNWFITGSHSHSPAGYLMNLICNKIRREKETIVAIDHVSFTVKRGEFVGILGPNGSGKTTLLKLLSCLLYPTEGNATIFGWDLIKDRKQVVALVNFVPGLLTGGIWVNPSLTAKENLKYVAKLFRYPVERIDEAIAFVGLEEVKNSRVATFSTGMSARLQLAFGILSQKPLFLMDEPMVGISFETARRIIKYIVDINKNLGVTILYSTNNIMEVQELCDNVMLLNNGKVVAFDTPHNLIKKIGTEDIIMIEVIGFSPGLLEDVEKLDVSNATYTLKDASLGIGDIRLSAKDSRIILPELVDLMTKKYDIKIRNVTIREPNLEDVFIYYTGRAIK